MTRFRAMAVASSSRPSSRRKSSKSLPMCFDLRLLVATMITLSTNQLRPRQSGLQIVLWNLLTLLDESVEQNRLVLHHRKEDPSDSIRKPYSHFPEVVGHF